MTQPKTLTLPLHDHIHTSSSSPFHPLCAEGLCWTRTAERQASRMRKMYLKSILRQDVGFFDTNATASMTHEVVTSLSSDAHVIQDVLTFLMSWQVALVVLPLSLLFIVPGVICGKLMMETAMKMKEAYGAAGAIVEQAISSIRMVVSYTGEHRTLERFGKALELSVNLGIKQGLFKGMAIGSIGMVFAVWSFQAWFGSVLVIHKGAAGGNVFIAGTCVLIGGLAVMSALPNVRYLSEAIAAASRIFKMVDKHPTIDPDDERGMILEEVRGEIEFKNIDFAYPSRPDFPVLEGFSLRVMPGETLGVVGGSGSGKSTVISLLERFYDPVRGDILLDKENIKNLQLKWLRSQMGLVSQEPILFATSIRENILFGDEMASMELIISAAKAANAHDFITALPDGYDTQVGQLGLQMSGGQKQRIAIARALLKDPKILLLDEATSALDAHSERLVQDALDQASVGRTTIIIAHHLSTLRKADLIVVIQSGKVVESGSHDELAQRDNGAYSTMLQLQQSATKTDASNSPNAQTEEETINHKNKMILKSPIMSARSSPGTSFTQDDSFSDKKEDISKSLSPSQWRLLQMNSPEFKEASFGSLGAIGFGAVQPLSSYCMGSIASVYFLKDNEDIKSQTRYYCFLFLGIAFVCIVTNLIQHYNFAIMGERLIKRVREKMLGKMLTFEMGWFDRDENTSAAICARLATEAHIVRSLIGDRLSLLLQASATAFLSFSLGIFIAWRLAIVMIAIQPLIIGCFYSKKVLMTNMSKRAYSAQNKSSQLSSEAVVNHRTITAFSSQKRVLKLYEASLKGPRSENIKQSWFAGIGLCMSQFLTTASIALAFWYGGRLVAQGQLTPKELLQAFFILMNTGKVIADAGSMTSDLAKGANAVKSVFAIIDRQTEIEPDDAKGVELKKMIKGHVELQNVYFSYPSRPGQVIFRGLSMKIEAGKTIALVGQSGSGKSTILGLIERFYDPLKGTVEIDQRDIKSYNLRYLRSHIALVSQEPTLFSGTIRENIAYGKENATEAEIKEAAGLANAHEFISSMKDGYGTYCGERGAQLSGGQKQRIVIARAILKNPSILLLDEATSALDSVSESLVQEALDKIVLGRTCITISHRLSAIQKSEFIAVIKNGRIVEQGTHSELLAVGHTGSYYSLVKAQEDSTSP
ncbi:ABC transporter [Cinnamomum micranthum f. kanehirae]|uniref:ABC transporter n=1 Tax=Cinnamomum micranthum f. kanehirae TaxID=337451 RepID=A0A443N750_9MAGN|nr:ABC transporter [Cinnamomum micranthum f. kanehirae]